MAKVFDNPEKHSVNLYDGKKYPAEKIVDITEDCPLAKEDERYLLTFISHDKKGRIFEISHVFKNNSCGSGMCIHFPVNALDSLMKPEPHGDALSVWTKILGIKRETLITLIKEHAPAA